MRNLQDWRKGKKASTRRKKKRSMARWRASRRRKRKRGGAQEAREKEARAQEEQEMIQEFFNGKEQRFTELVAVSSTHTETVCQCVGKVELWDWIDVEEQTSVPSCFKHGELLMKLLDIWL